MGDEEQIEKAQSRYVTAMHAMQTGVGYKMQFDGKETEPKHLRVGVNSALTSVGALTKLLIANGVITELEYWTAVADDMEQQKANYEQELRDRFNANVTLG